MPDVINERYEIMHRLGQGEMATIFQARDLYTEQLIALKYLPHTNLDPYTLSQLKHEFAALKQFHHPNLVDVYELDQVSGEDSYFFTMANIGGQTWRTWAQEHLIPHQQQAYPVFYEQIAQLCRALMYIHQQGLIHYDLKPDNVLVTSEGQIKLIDFGLSSAVSQESGQHLRGSPAYMAPEYIQGFAVDHRLDLYALGVSLFELTTAHLPFPAPDTTTILRHHLLTPPAIPTAFATKIPLPLQRIILRLLEKRPQQRFRTANDVIYALNEHSPVAYTLEETIPSMLTTSTDQSPLVGHTDAFDQLQRRLQQAQHNHGSLTLLSGSEGVGKTRLLRELKTQATLRNCLVFEGFCLAEAQVPYAPWLDILSQLVAYHRQHMPEILQVHAAPLQHLLPQLGDQLNETVPANKITVDKQNLMTATTRLLRACDQPAAILIENLHLADTETLDLLLHLANEASNHRWLLAGSYNPHAIDSEHPLNALLHQITVFEREHLTIVSLTKLSPALSVELVQNLLETDYPPEVLLPPLVTISQGNPLFIEMLVHLLRLEGSLYAGEQHWTFVVEQLVGLPESLNAVLQRLYDLLPAEAKQLLLWAAVINYPLELDILTRVTTLPALTLRQQLQQLLRHRFLRLVEHNGQPKYQFYHQRIRQFVYEQLVTDQHQSYHQRVGEALQSLHPEADLAESLAWHFYEALAATEALHYATLAADKARRVYAHDLAIQKLNLALTLLRTQPDLTDPETEYDILNKQQDCYRHLGHRAEQQACLDDMHQLAQRLNSIGKQITVAVRQADLLNKLGQNQLARQAAEEAVTLAGNQSDRRWLADSLEALGNALFDLSELEETRKCYERALAIYQTQGNRHGEAVVLRKLGNVAARSGDLTQAQAYHSQALYLARLLGDRISESATLSSLGSIQPDRAQSWQYHEQALALAQSVGDRGNMTMVLNNLALVYLSLGLYARARDYAEQAVSLTEQMGDRNNLAYYLDTLGQIYLELDLHRQAREVFMRGQMLSVAVNDPWVELAHWNGLGRVAMAEEDYDNAQTCFTAAQRLEMQSEAWGDMAATLSWLGYIHLQTGQWSLAAETTAQAITYLEQFGSASEYPVQMVWWLRFQVLKADPGHNSPPLSPEAWRCLQNAYQTMMAGIATLSDPGLRRNYLNKVALNRDILLEWAHYNPDTSELTNLNSSLDKPLEQTPNAPQSEGVLKRILDISVQMSQFHTPDALLNYTLDQAIELTGAERGFLMLLDETDRPHFEVTRGLPSGSFDELRRQISESVLSTVVQTKTPVLLQDAMTNTQFNTRSSVLDLNLRSVLCVPLLVRSRLIGLIYIDNRSAGGRFVQADVDLMTIFATQAAAAIENARLYEEKTRTNQALAEWNQTLEQRVAERTMELEQANTALSAYAARLETSSHIGQRITTTLDMETLIPDVVRLLQQHFSYYFVGIWMMNQAADSLILRAAGLNDDSRTIEPGQALPLNVTSIVTQAGQSGQEMVAQKAQQHPNFRQSDILPDTRAQMVLPLKIGRQVIGVLDVHHNTENSFTPEDQWMLRVLANQITVAINNAQLYRLETERRHLSEALEHTGRVLSTNLSVREIPGKILSELASIVPFDYGILWHQQDQALHMLAHHGNGVVPKQAVQIPVRPGHVFEQIIKSRQYLIINDTNTQQNWSSDYADPEQRAWLGAPLIAHGQVHGILTLSRNEAHTFHNDDGVLVQTFAGQAAVALQNAQLYDEISRMNDDLEQKVQERTEELKQAYQTLTRLDQTKADFIRVASHELRTPLTVINGYAQLLRANSQESEQKDMLDGILAGAGRMEEVVSSMLDVTKIDNQVMQVHRETIMIAIVIDRVRQRFATDMAKRNISFATHNVNSLPLIAADRNLLDKVFHHLIINAIKYTPDSGQITITGEHLTHDPQRAWIQICVQDTGIGIASDQLDLIFEKFYQTGPVALHSSGRTSFKGGGPGLGLAIVKGIIAAHGGQIWAESEGYSEEACPGSTFCIRLPVSA